MATWRGDNCASLERAVSSVYENRLPPEAFMLVVDGAVPAPLEETIASLEKRFGFEAVRLPENVGLAKALNAGVERIKTNWVVRADADDVNLPTRFRQLAEAVNSEAAPDLLGSAILEVDPNGRAQAVRSVPLCHRAIVRRMKRRNPFNHQTVAYRRELIERCGGYPNIHLKEDYGLWALMVRFGAVTMNLPDVLVHATAGPDMYDRRGGWRYALAEIRLQEHLVLCGIKKPLWAVLHGAARAMVFLVSTRARARIYSIFLRDRPFTTLS